QREAILVYPLRQSFRVIAAGLRDQRLDFDEQRSAPFPGDGYHTARAGDGRLRKKNSRRVSYLAEARFGHREHTHFAARAEPVLDRPDDRIAAAGVAFEIEHRIDHVFDDPRAGDGTFLRYVTDEKERDVPLLRKLHDAPDTFTQLRNGTGR